MSTEHLLREFYNQMYRVHTQLDNAYDLGDHLHHLTVHKHLDQDPLIQFREAYRWVDQAGARLVADAGCGYGGFVVFVARRAPTLSVDGYTLSNVQRAVARQALARLHQSKSRALLQVTTASSGSMMRLSPLNRLATQPMWGQPCSIGPGIYGQGAW